MAATNINSGKITYFQEGSVLDAVLASAAIPVLFDPVEIDGDLYVDGGVLDNFPLKPLAKAMQEGDWCIAQSHTSRGGIHKPVVHC